MKWQEVQNLPPEAHLTRFGGRRAVLIEIHGLIKLITIRYIDDNSRERIAPSEVDLGWKPPEGTVARDAP